MRDRLGQRFAWFRGEAGHIQKDVPGQYYAEVPDRDWALYSTDPHELLDAMLDQVAQLPDGTAPDPEKVAILQKGVEVWQKELDRVRQELAKAQDRLTQALSTPSTLTNRVTADRQTLHRLWNFVMPDVKIDGMAIRVLDKPRPYHSLKGFELLRYGFDHPHIEEIQREEQDD